MGHSTHFLQRLSRVDHWHTQTALALYRDPALVREVLFKTRVPEAASRVALALDDEGRGPHIIVSRDGQFITCLGQGMEPYDVFRVPRAALDAIRDLRTSVDLSLKALMDGSEEILKMGGGEYFIKRLMRGAHTVNRDEIRMLRKLTPLIATELILNHSGVHMAMSAQRKALLPYLNLPRGEQRLIKEREEELRNYWCNVWAHNHVTTLFGVWSQHLEWDIYIPEDKIIDESQQQDRARYGEKWMQANILSLSLWTASRSGSLIHMVRAAWGVAHAFRLAREKVVDMVAESIHARYEIAFRYLSGLFAYIMITSDEEMESLLELMVERFGARHALMEVEGQPPLKTLELGDDASVHGKFAITLIGFALAMRRSAGELPSELVGINQKDLVTRLQQHRAIEKQRYAEKLRALDPHTFFLYRCCFMPLLKGKAEEGVELLTTIAHAMSFKQPEDLYFEDTTNRVTTPKYEPDMVVYLLKNDMLVAPKLPVQHQQPAPGRNDPCPCGSGKKYKKCCALSAE